MKLTTRLILAIVILVMTVFIGGGNTAQRAWAQANTWHVAIDGSDITGDSSETNPFATIQHGIDVVSDDDNSIPALLYSTYLGGTESDLAQDMATDGDGNVYIVGLTTSPDFPTSPDAYDGSYNGSMDAFLVKLSADGSTLLYSTYLGGSGEESGAGVALDGDGNIYVTGHTYSVDFPTTPGALDTTLGGGRDGFVAKLSADGSTLLYSTYLGGNNWDYGNCIAVDVAGSAYVGGFTHGSFPVTPGAAQTGFGGLGDGFVVKLSPDGGFMVYGTYLGGSNWERNARIAVDPDGNVYTVAGTSSDDFPTTPGAYDTVCESCLAGVGGDAYATKLSADGSSFVYSTFVGGADAGDEDFFDIVVDSEGNAYLAGDSAADDFPTTPGTLQPVFQGGEHDAIVVKLNADGSDLLYSTYVGGAGLDVALKLAIDSAGNAYVAGITESSDFPTAFPWQPANAGGREAFVVKLDQDASTLLFGTYFGGSGDEYEYQQFPNYIGFDLISDGVVLAGATASTDLPTTPGAYDEPFNGGAYDAFVAHLSDNQPPVASAGPDQVVNRLAPVTLDGSGSTDPDGDLPLTYLWAQTGGPAVTFTPHLSVTTFTAPGDPGVLTFTLTVTDSLGLPDPTPDEVVIAVQPHTSVISFTRITTGDIVTDPAYGPLACWGDYDNDGYLDLFAPNWSGQNNFLYHNNADGTFEKITDGAVVNDGGWSRACTWGDYDNDGYPDLFVSNDGGGNFLYHNEGGTSFTRVLTGPIPRDGGNCYGSAWVDYDSDGWLDLFVARHTNANNLLYHNLGDGTFEKITAGAIVNDGGYSHSIAWGDYDDDGCPDLWVGNANTQNDFLYHNNCDGTFTKITHGPIVIDGAFSGSGNWVDHDNDLDLDLFVANRDGDNFLYQNNGDGSFTSITSTLIVTEGVVADSAWADLDNDGDLDLYMGASYQGLHRLYRNDGGGTFVPILDVPVVEDPDSTTGIWGDYDNDGDLDLYVARGGGYTNLLYRNETTGNHWINFNLVGTVSNRSAIGARVTIEASIGGAPVSQVREVSGQTGGFNQDSLNVEFGLGDATVIDSLVVEWPSGIVQHWQNVAADQFMTIIESSDSTFSISGCVTGASGQGIPDVTISATGGYSTTTDASGAYTLTELLPSTYTVTPTIEGYSFDPRMRTVTVPPDATDQDFVGTLLTHPPLLYSTYFGGSDSDRVRDVAVDGEGNVYIVGVTSSPDLPTTPDAHDDSLNGNMDAFWAKLSADGSTLLYSTYLGGSGEDQGVSIVLDDEGSIYIAGQTYSVDFPVTPGAMDQTLNGERDAFVAKFSPAGELVGSTYLGGDNWDYGNCIAVDDYGSVYVGGFTHGSGRMYQLGGAANANRSSNRPLTQASRK